MAAQAYNTPSALYAQRMGLEALMALRNDPDTGNRIGELEHRLRDTPSDTLEDVASKLLTALILMEFEGDAARKMIESALTDLAHLDCPLSAAHCPSG